MGIKKHFKNKTYTIRKEKSRTMVIKLHHANELKTLIQNVQYGEKKVKKVILQTPRGIKWIHRVQMTQKGQTHKTAKCPYNLEIVVSRNDGGGTYMGKLSGQETSTIPCKWWAKKTAEKR